MKLEACCNTEHVPECHGKIQEFLRLYASCGLPCILPWQRSLSCRTRGLGSIIGHIAFPRTSGPTSNNKWYRSESCLFMMCTSSLKRVGGQKNEQNVQEPSSNLCFLLFLELYIHIANVINKKQGKFTDKTECHKSPMIPEIVSNTPKLNRIQSIKKCGEIN